MQKEPVSKQASTGTRPQIRVLRNKDRGFPHFNPAIISRALSRSLHRTRLTTSASGPPPTPRGSYKIHLYGLYDADTVRHLHLHPSGHKAHRHSSSMGLVYNTYLNSDKIFGCKNCKTHLASHDAIISRVRSPALVAFPVTCTLSCLRCKYAGGILPCATEPWCILWQVEHC